MGLSGWELKGRTWSGFGKNTARSLYVSERSATDNKVVVCESGLDAASYAQLHDDGRTVYASTGGAATDKQVEELKRLLAAMPETTEVVLAFDRDAAGDEYTKKFERAFGGASAMKVTDARPGRLKGALLATTDWNDALRNKAWMELLDSAYPAAHSCNKEWLAAQMRQKFGGSALAKGTDCRFAIERPNGRASLVRVDAVSGTSAGMGGVWSANAKLGKNDDPSTEITVLCRTPWHALAHHAQMLTTEGDGKAKRIRYVSLSGSWMNSAEGSGPLRPADRIAELDVKSDVKKLAQQILADAKGEVRVLGGDNDKAFWHRLLPQGTQTVVSELPAERLSPRLAERRPEIHVRRRQPKLSMPLPTEKTPA